MNLAAVMDEIATTLSSVPGLRVWGYPPGSVTPPAAVVGYPVEHQYDVTYGRGMDAMTIPVVVVVPNPTERPARDAVSAYTAGTGVSSVKAVLESASYTALHSIRVASVAYDTYSIGGAEYLGAIFEVEITGSG